MYLEDEAALPPIVDPAPLGARIGAGAIDAAAIGLLSLCFIFLTTLLASGSLPLLAIFVAVLIWSVGPLFTFGATAGMTMFKISLVARDGTQLDLLEVLFREMVGRGWFAIAYLGTLMVGLVGTLTGRASFTLPMGLSLIVSGFAMLVLGVTTVGHVLVFARPDGRGLPDLMAKTIVTPRRIQAQPTDEEEREWARARHRTRIRNFVIAQVLLASLAIGLPLALTIDLPGFDPNALDTSDIELEGKRNRFEANKANARIANDLVWALEDAGHSEDAHDVRVAHESAVSASRIKREEWLRTALARNPTDWDTFGLLIEFLGEEDRTEDAKKVYLDFVAADTSPEVRAGFGIWLYRRDFSDEAITELSRAIEEGEPSGRLYSYLGYAQRDLDHLEEAREAFAHALELDPDLYRTRGALEELNEVLGPPSEDTF